MRSALAEVPTLWACVRVSEPPWARHRHPEPMTGWGEVVTQGARGQFPTELGSCLEGDRCAVWAEALGPPSPESRPVRPSVLLSLCVSSGKRSQMTWSWLLWASGVQSPWAAQRTACKSLAFVSHCLEISPFSLAGVGAEPA